MGFREQYGQMAEDLLNAAVDKYLNADDIKAKINEMVDEKLVDLKHKLKAEVIDLIDGEDDIK